MSIFCHKRLQGVIEMMGPTPPDTLSSEERLRTTTSVRLARLIANLKTNALQTSTPSISTVWTDQQSEHWCFALNHRCNKRLAKFIRVARIWMQGGRGGLLRVRCKKGCLLPTKEWAWGGGYMHPHSKFLHFLCENKGICCISALFWVTE